MTVTADKLQSQAISVEAPSDFEALFQAHWPQVYAVIYRLVGDPDEAEDLALGVFIKLHQRPPRNDENISGWLYRVATNLGLNALRARVRRAQYELQAGKIDLGNAHSQNPAVSFEKAEESQRVRQVLHAMRPRLSKILILRHSGFSYAEIAATLKISPQSVGKLLNRAERVFEKHYLALETR